MDEKNPITITVKLTTEIPPIMIPDITMLDTPIPATMILDTLTMTAAIVEMVKLKFFTARHTELVIHLTLLPFLHSRNMDKQAMTI